LTLLAWLTILFSRRFRFCLFRLTLCLLGIGLLLILLDFFLGRIEREIVFRFVVNGHATRSIE
jgi:hypothetical protein